MRRNSSPLVRLQCRLSTAHWLIVLLAGGSLCLLSACKQQPDQEAVDEYKYDRAQLVVSQELLQGGNDEVALQGFQRLIEKKAFLDESYAGRGQVYYLRGQYQDAIADLTRAIELAKEAPADWFLRRGVSYAVLEENEKALVDFDTAIYRDPKLAEAYAARALVHGRLKDFDRQAKDRSKSVELEPAYQEAPYALPKRPSVEDVLGHK